MREFTVAQAEKLVCPIMSRSDYRHCCKTTSCMGWEWSSPNDTAIITTMVGEAKHISELVPPKDDGQGPWTLDLEEDRYGVAPCIGNDGVICRVYTDREKLGAKSCAQSSTAVRWKRPWTDARLGSCSLCAARVVDVDVSN